MPRLSAESSHSSPRPADSPPARHSGDADSSNVPQPEPRKSSTYRRPTASQLLDLDFPQPDEAEHRLRQLDKVTRTLGEQVPAELILGRGGPFDNLTGPGPQRTPSQKRRFKTLRRRTSISTPAFISNFGKGSLKADVPPNPSLLTAPLTYGDRDQNSSPGGISPIEFSPPSPAESGPTASDRLKHRSKSVSATRSRPSASEDGHSMSNPSISPPPGVRSETPFVDTTNDDYKSSVWVSDGRGHVIRSERKQGWSGAWNQQDMGDVISKLRNLK